MLNKIKDFFEEEYTSTKKYLKSPYAEGCERMVVYKNISRCLGVSLFVQNIGVSYEDINPVYEIYKKKLELLLDK